MVSESLLKVIIFNGGIHKHEIKKQNSKKKKTHNTMFKGLISNLYKKCSTQVDRKMS